jgi:hypothetical protein
VSPGPSPFKVSPPRESHTRYLLGRAGGVPRLSPDTVYRSMTPLHGDTRHASLIEAHAKERPLTSRLKTNANTDKHSIDSRIMILTTQNIQSDRFSVGIVLVPDRDIILSDVIPQ